MFYTGCLHWMCLHNGMMQIKSTMNFPHTELELAINAGKCRCRKRSFNWINCTSWTHTKSERVDWNGCKLEWGKNEWTVRLFVCEVNQSQFPPWFNSLIAFALKNCARTKLNWLQNQSIKTFIKIKNKKGEKKNFQFSMKKFSFLKAFDEDFLLSSFELLQCQIFEEDEAWFTPGKVGNTNAKCKKQFRQKKEIVGEPFLLFFFRLFFFNLFLATVSQCFN